MEVWSAAHYGRLRLATVSYGPALSWFDQKYYSCCSELQNLVQLYLGSLTPTPSREAHPTPEVPFLLLIASCSLGYTRAVIVLWNT